MLKTIKLDSVPFIQTVMYRNQGPSSQQKDSCLFLWLNFVILPHQWWNKNSDAILKALYTRPLCRVNKYLTVKYQKDWETYVSRKHMYKLRRISTSQNPHHTVMG